MSSQLVAALAPVRLAEDVLVSVVIPCLNEADNIVECVTTAQTVLAEHGLAGEVVVVDNGSDDGSAELAESAGARVIREPRRGYGRAYRTGFAEARGDYIVMVDADLTYDFREIPRFIAELEDGAELVMGNRMQNIQPGAMPWMNRYIGNPLLSGFLNLLFRTNVRDAHCGMRAVRREVLPRLGLCSTGMEFASEMVIRAARSNLDIREFPIALHPRGGVSKLNPFTDGWRHLRLMLMHNPNALFLLPGLVAALAGVAIMAATLGGVSLFGHVLQLHAMIGGSLLVVVGTQLLAFGFCGRIYVVMQLGDRDEWLETWMGRLRLEHGLLIGGGLTLLGVSLGGIVVAKWLAYGLGSLSEENLTMVAATLVIVGIQVFFTSFLLSLLALRRPGR